MTTARLTEGVKSRRAEAEEILRDRLAGATVYELEQRYELSSATIYRRMDEALEHRLAPTVDAYRKQQNEILDRQQARLEQQVVGYDALVVAASAGAEVVDGIRVVDPDKVASALAGRLRAVEAIIRLTERRAKLNGLDMPQRVEVDVVVHDAADVELAQMLDRADEATA